MPTVNLSLQGLRRFSWIKRAEALRQFCLCLVVDLSKSGKCNLLAGNHFDYLPVVVLYWQDNYSRIYYAKVWQLTQENPCAAI